MNNTYSISIGIKKGVIGFAITAISIVSVLLAANYPELANASVIDVLSKYAKEILGTVSIAGLLTMVVNALKFYLQK